MNVLYHSTGEGHLLNRKTRNGLDMADGTEISLVGAQGDGFQQ